MVDSTNPYADLISKAPTASAAAPTANPYADLIPPQADSWETGGSNEPSIAARANAPPPRSPDWSVNWKGNVTLPQPVQDFGNLMAEQATVGGSFPYQVWESQGTDQPTNLATLKAQSGAERERLGPVASTMADIAGYGLSPVQLLNDVPGGTMLGGALQEGIKSKLEGDDWMTAYKKAREGLAAGVAGSTIAHVLTSPAVLGKLVETGGMGGTALLAHTIFGGSPTATWLGGGAGQRWAEPIVKRVEAGASAIDPYIQSGIKNLVRGVASSIQQMPGNPWSQWVTGQ
jgi:hypothetical protein